MSPSTPLTLKVVAPVFHALMDEPVTTVPSRALSASAARAVTGSSPQSTHRHSVRPNIRFLIFIVLPLLSKTHSAFGSPKAVVRVPHHNVFARRRS